MALKLPPLKNISASHLSDLQKNLVTLVSEDSLSAIIQSVLDKIGKNEKIDMNEVTILVDWQEKLKEGELSTFRAYISNRSDGDNQFLLLLSEYISELRQPKTVEFIITLMPIQKRLNEKQRKSFELYHKNEDLSKRQGKEIVEYLENICFLQLSEFTNGQKRESAKFIFQANFSDLFESDFDHLKMFFENAGVNGTKPLLELLDRQLGFIIDKNEAEITAKALNQSFGYFKFRQLVESHSGQFDVNQLANYKKLKKLIEKFDEAVSILQGKEQKRGTFWKEILHQVEGVKYKRFSMKQYSIAVGFMVGDFVICDFGPSGNPVYIYDRKIFMEHIEKSNDWRRDPYLTRRLSPSRIDHRSGWDEKVRRLIREARKYG